MEEAAGAETAAVAAAGRVAGSVERDGVDIADRVAVTAALHATQLAHTVWTCAFEAAGDGVGASGVRAVDGADRGASDGSVNAIDAMHDEAARTGRAAVLTAGVEARIEAQRRTCVGACVAAVRVANGQQRMRGAVTDAHASGRDDAVGIANLTAADAGGGGGAGA